MKILPNKPKIAVTVIAKRLWSVNMATPNCLFLCDREGEHEALIVRKHQKNLPGIEESIIALYSKGMTVRDVQNHLNQLYGITVSPTLISNVTNKPSS